jgi:heme-degrading monooxygenase HmoA
LAGGRTRHPVEEVRFVAIFRATVDQRDADDAATAAHLRDLALTRYGCLDFAACEQDGLEIAVSYWPNQHAIPARCEDPAHRAAQQKGSQHGYNGNRVEVAAICRYYSGAGHHVS